MSFHATRVLLPESASLTVTANGVRYVYTAKDTRDGELWSRISRGDSLAFELRVPTNDASRVSLEIVSMQAGYRAFGRGMRNHRHYDAIRAQSPGTTAAASLPSCAENWSCNVTPTNEAPGNATVALLIGNVGQCSGVLLNNARQDGTPYVLTARHCENGSSDGGTPGNAANVEVYWDVVTPCGTDLGSIYDPGQKTQYGATTVVEQQDAWLIRLNQQPIVDAYYAGWDATGAAIVGGFTPHHASGSARQFIGWYGQSAYITKPVGSFENVHYASTLWGTVNEKGAAGGGASGAGLFDASGRLVGTFVRSSESIAGVGVCPNSPAQAPTDTTATGFSTALSGIFNSTADPVSTTGSVTLQSVLDPDHTGVQVLDGQKRIAVSLYVTSLAPYTGVPDSLQWSTPSGQTCTASGGVSGDGWAGPLTNSGSKDVISYDEGDVTYTVTCTDGQRSGSASRTLHWTFLSASVSLGSNTWAEYGVPFTLTWSSSVTPCTATGGRSGDGWSGALGPRGSKSVTETTVDSVTYTITCGSGTRTAFDTYSTTVLAPSVTMTSDATTLRTDQPAYIYIGHYGAPCVKTGGGAGDGWAGSLPVGANNNSLTATINESTPGIYIYTVTCGSGANIATGQVTLAFTNAAAAAVIQASAATGGIDSDILTLTWDSNVRPCLVGYDGPEGSNTIPTNGTLHGSATVQSSVIGPYDYWVKCGSGANSTQASTTVNWTGTPSVRLIAPLVAVRDTPFHMEYLSNIAPCVTSGGIAGDGWAGQSFASALHGVNITEQAVSKPTFTVTCGSGAQVATATVSVDIVVDAPTVTLVSDKTVQLPGQPITFTWSANYQPCQLSGGRVGDGWSGTVGATGSMTVAEPVQGAYTYYILCGTATAYKSVEFLDHPPPILTVSKTAVAIGDVVTLTWVSLDGAPCRAGGGVTGDGWAGSRAASGSMDIKETVTGRTEFSLICSYPYPTVAAVTFYNPPTVTLSASATTLTVGNSVTLAYEGKYAFNCTSSGGSPTDGWASTFFLNGGGTRTIQETSPGTYVYSLSCTGDQDSKTSASATVVFNAASQPSPPASTGGGSSSSGGGGGGGGGALGPIDIGCYLALSLIAWRRRRQTPRCSAGNRYAIRCRDGEPGGEGVIGLLQSKLPAASASRGAA